MSETTELAVVKPSELMRQASDVAGVCREIVAKTAKKIQGRKYVCVEGWSAIAIAHGCVLSARDVEQLETGVRATGEVRRMSDGVVLATAEGFVGNDESMWAKRPEYARRAMAQTRGMSRAARTAFAHVIVMIDGNLSTTPAEEIPEGEHEVNGKRSELEQTALQKLEARLAKHAHSREALENTSVHWDAALADGIVSEADHKTGQEKIRAALEAANGK